MMNDWIRGMILDWLHTQAGQVVDILGWGGIAALAAGGLLFLSLSAKLLKLFSSKLGMVLVAAVMVVGLYFAGIGRPDAATLEDADGPIMAKRWEPEAASMSGMDAMAMPVMPPATPLLPATSTLPFAMPMLWPGVAAPAVTHSHSAPLHHPAVGGAHHHATASVASPAAVHPHLVTPPPVKPHSGHLAAPTPAPAASPAHPAITHHAGAASGKPAENAATHPPAASSANTLFHHLPTPGAMASGLGHLLETIHQRGESRPTPSPASPPHPPSHHPAPATGPAPSPVVTHHAVSKPVETPPASTNPATAHSSHSSYGDWMHQAYAGSQFGTPSLHLPHWASGQPSLGFDHSYGHKATQPASATPAQSPGVAAKPSGPKPLSAEELQEHERFAQSLRLPPPLRQQRSGGSFSGGFSNHAGGSGYSPAASRPGMGYSGHPAAGGHSRAMTNRQAIHQHNQMANHLMNQWMGQQFHSMGMGHPGGMHMGGHPAAGGMHPMGGMHHMGGHH